MSAITDMDEAIRLLRQAAQSMTEQRCPSPTIRQLDSLIHDLIGYVEDLPSVLAEDAFEDGGHCADCVFCAVQKDRLPYGNRYVERIDWECTAPGASDCPAVKRVYGDDQ